jgi:DNA-binding NarL/FixJ family response regulator
MREKQAGDEIKRILIVDDHPLITRGLSQMINDEKGLTVCGEARDINEAMEKIASLDPHMLIVDISLRNSSGIDLLKAVKVRHPGLPALVYSMHEESVYAERVLRAGARGYVMKDASADIIMRAIRKILSGNIFFSDAIVTKLINRYSNIKNGDVQLPINRLTNRELEVFQLIGHELKSSQIARKLNISIKTVEAHREHIRKKLDMADPIELVRYAKEWIHGRGSRKSG